MIRGSGAESPVGVKSTELVLRDRRVKAILVEIPDFTDNIRIVYILDINEKGIRGFVSAEKD